MKISILLDEDIDMDEASWGFRYFEILLTEKISEYDVHAILMWAQYVKIEEYQILPFLIVGISFDFVEIILKN